MRTRTYSRAAFEEAQRLWRDGEFGPEWNRWRSLAADAGIIMPPNGTRHDDVDDDEPSQRAMVYRAMGETPELLRRSLVGAYSWGEVVRRVLAGRDSLRDDVELAEKDAAWDRDQDAPTHREAVMALGTLLQRIDDSR